MTDAFDGITERVALASAGFEERLRKVGRDRWMAPTPCGDWNVRQLVNHVTRGNLNYRDLVAGASSADFLRRRDADALGDDALGAFRESVATCLAAFREPGALDRTLDYPLGRIRGAQALAVRTTDTTIHTWDLARATGLAEDLDPDLLVWISTRIGSIYAGLPETPVSPITTHHFFAAPTSPPATSTPPSTRTQDRLLRLTGRDPT